MELNRFQITTKISDSHDNQNRNSKSANRNQGRLSITEHKNYLTVIISDTKKHLNDIRHWNDEYKQIKFIKII